MIQHVAVVSTGSVRIRPQHARRDRSPVPWWLLTSRVWTAPRPINVYVIEHSDGLVLFDTGQDRSSVTDPDYFPGGLAGYLYRRLAQFTIDADDTLTAQLAAVGYDIADVRTVVLSHLHQDHIGGLPELGHARIIVSAVELDSVRRPGALLNGVMRRHIELPGLRWDTDAAPDLFGDGTLVLVPTPGHTAGSLSLLLRQDGLPPMLFVGDLTYDVSLLESGDVPGIGRRAELQRSSALVKELRRQHPGLLILAAHDPAAAGMLAL